MAVGEDLIEVGREDGYIHTSRRDADEDGGTFARG